MEKSVITKKSKKLIHTEKLIRDDSIERDWYDFEWYVRNGIQLDFIHLQERIREFNGIEMDKEGFIKLLKERLASTDIKMVKQDVEPFIKNTESLEIWSNDYFLQLADMVKFE